MTQEEILEKIRYHAGLRGLSKWTIHGYLQDTKRFQKYYGKSATELGLEDIQAYIHHQQTVRGNASVTINRALTSMRFLYGVVLEIPLDFNKLPSLRTHRSFPEIMTRAEVTSLFDACDKLRDRAILMTAYGAGLRASEITNLRVSSIDSANMQIFICNGKGGKDRFALLSQANLDILREYWLAYRPKEHLFLSRLGRPMSVRSVEDVFNKAKKSAGITKKVTLHTLRHCFATHLLEDGVSIYHIKQLLGHAHISTTCFYLHLVKIRDLDVVSPLDKLYPGDRDA